MAAGIVTVVWAPTAVVAALGPTAAATPAFAATAFAGASGPAGSTAGVRVDRTTAIATRVTRAATSTPTAIAARFAHLRHILCM